MKADPQNKSMSIWTSFWVRSQDPRRQSGPTFYELYICRNCPGEIKLLTRLRNEMGWEISGMMVFLILGETNQSFPFLRRRGPLIFLSRICKMISGVIDWTKTTGRWPGGTQQGKKFPKHQILRYFTRLSQLLPKSQLGNKNEGNGGSWRDQRESGGEILMRGEIGWRKRKRCLRLFHFSYDDSPGKEERRSGYDKMKWW